MHSVSMTFPTLAPPAEAMVGLVVDPAGETALFNQYPVPQLPTTTTD